MITDLQKRTAQAILNIFETGSACGDYGNVTLIPGDTGHLTYGRSQTTLASGNLFLLVQSYVNAPGAQLAGSLTPYLPRLQARDLSLDHDAALRSLLEQAGDDPVMRRVQDGFFDRIYWNPAQIYCGNLQIASALGVGVVYDGIIHGSFTVIRDLTNKAVGSIAGGTAEPDWISRYVAIRRDWLANNANTALHPTVYRMDAFKLLIREKAWELPLPLVVRGVRIDEAVLAGQPHRVSAHVVEERLLMLASPMMQGDDVRAVQAAPEARGIPVGTDGVYGEHTASAVRRFQSANDMTADGIVGPATRAALGL